MFLPSFCIYIHYTTKAREGPGNKTMVVFMFAMYLRVCVGVSTHSRRSSWWSGIFTTAH